MKNEESIILKRDCDAVMIPSGEKIKLLAGSSVWITQPLGAGYTLMTDRGHMVRVDGNDIDALGMEITREGKPSGGPSAASAEEIEAKVWNELKSCFDPEIPVNIVDLGLIYECRVLPLGKSGYRAEVAFTLTARGCGMGETLKGDIRRKLLAVPGVREVEVNLVWDPPWNQSMISGAAKQRLGIS